MKLHVFTNLLFLAHSCVCPSLDDAKHCVILVKPAASITAAIESYVVRYMEQKISRLTSYNGNSLINACS